MLYLDEKRKILIGQRIKIWIKQRKLTQEKLAELIKRSTDAVSMIERGINFPSRETLEKMSKAFHIPVAEFLVNDNEEVVISARERIISKIICILHELDDKNLQMALKHIEILCDK